MKSILLILSLSGTAFAETRAETIALYHGMAAAARAELAKLQAMSAEQRRTESHMASVRYTERAIRRFEEQEAAARGGR